MIHPDYQRRVLAGTENDTAYLDDLFDVGWPDAPHRVLRNSTVTDWEAAGRPPPGRRPGEGEIIATAESVGEIERYACVTPRPDAVGAIEAMPMWAGQGVALVHRVQPAAEILREIHEDARGILRRLAD